MQNWLYYDNSNGNYLVQLFRFKNQETPSFYQQNQLVSAGWPDCSCFTGNYSFGVHRPAPHHPTDLPMVGCRAHWGASDVPGVEYGVPVSRDRRAASPGVPVLKQLLQGNHAPVYSDGMCSGGVERKLLWNSLR